MKTSDDFAQSWLTYQRARAGSALWLTCEWVVGAEQEWAEARPQELFEAVVIITSEALSNWEVELLGSGPLETLINKKYEEICDRLFRQAGINVLLHRALEYVNPPPEFEADFERRIEEAQNT